MTARNRVAENTTEVVNQEIQRRIRGNIAYYADHPAAIPDRLRVLERRWDIEQVLEAMSASFTLVGLSMALLRRKRWLILPLAVQSFFLQHAIQGWCPPLSVLRRLGVRTTDEINAEIIALRGILKQNSRSPSPREAPREAPLYAVPMSGSAGDE